MVEYLLYKDATKVDLIEKESNKNSKNIYCPVCNCIVLLKNMVIANESKDEFTVSKLFIYIYIYFFFFLILVKY